jgi:microcystin-dependent protein
VTIGPIESNSIHLNSDLNIGPNAQHHTLGTGPGQAASGNHVHDDFVVGDIKIAAYAGDSGNWFVCDGRQLPRLLYPVLFARISTIWGIGNGSSTFNIPNSAGRAIVAAGAGAGLTVRALAALWGAEDSVVVTHTHSGNSGNDSLGGSNGLGEHYHGGTSDGDAPDHAHAMPISNISWAGTGSGSVTRLAAQGSYGYNTAGATARHTHTFTTGGRSHFHQHPFTAPAPAGASSGLGTNSPPSAAFTVLIKVR